MTKRFALLLCSLLVALQALAQEHILWYDHPATRWEERLPLGNGRLGMMPDGGIANERIILNDISMWSGSYDPTQWKEGASNYLPSIREALLKGDNQLAQDLVYHHFVCGGKGSNHGQSATTPYGSFQMLGWLNLQHQLPDSSYSDYRFQLDLDEALLTTSFKMGEVEYRREYIASHGKEDVLAIRLTASQKGKISFTTQLWRPSQYQLSIAPDEITLEGQLEDGWGTDKGVTYKAQLKIYPIGGEVSISEGGLKVMNADEVLLLIGNTTSLLPGKSDLSHGNWQELLSHHLQSYQEKYHRVTIHLDSKVDHHVLS